MDLLTSIVTDWRVKTILALIVVDVIMGIAAAIKQRMFQWEAVGNFYLTMILPYLLGYAALFGASKLLLGEWLGPYGFIVSEGVVSMAWLAIIASLVGSIVRNGRAVGYAFPDGNEEPAPQS